MSTMSRLFISLFCIVFNVLTNSFVDCSLQCLSTDWKPVDWYIIYKAPKLSTNPNPYIRDGVVMYYMDSAATSWQTLLTPINLTMDHPIYNTLEPIYSHALKNGTYMYAWYNDEIPNHKASSTYGHTKGAVAFDQSSGFWMIHSAPHFPSFEKDGYIWPTTSSRYGQTFLCISLGYNMLDVIGKQMMYNYPQIYDWVLPPSFASKNPNMANAINKKHCTAKPWFNFEKLITLGGTTFASFAKFSKFNADLYHDFVAPVLAADLKTETWRNGRGNIPSNCTGMYKVFNIKQFRITGNVEFTTTHDHAKWAVTTNVPWICIGDINRQSAQFHRGGGTACMSNKNIWKTFSNGILDYEKCP